MAKALILPAAPAVMAEVSPATPEQVVLTFSRDEAQTLADILSRVGGGPETRRRFADQMLAALRSVDIRYTWYLTMVGSGHGAKDLSDRMYFTK